MEGFTAILACEAPDVPMGAHHAFPLPKLSGFLAARALDLGSDNPGRNGADNAARDLVLNGKNVLESAVVALGPDVMAPAVIGSALARNLVVSLGLADRGVYARRTN